MYINTQKNEYNLKNKKSIGENTKPESPYVSIK